MTAIKECRVCGKYVAARATRCPGCGVKKPTATKVEANLDAVASTAFALGLLCVVIVVVLVACIGIVAG